MDGRTEGRIDGYGLGTVLLLFISLLTISILPCLTRDPWVQIMI
jgi:hypothetical protein